MTTKPFLFIDLSPSLDLEKSWKEHMHPRDKFGKFTTVKGGSRVVSKTGKTGVVHKVTDTHYHVTDDKGGKFKVMKDNALHFNDHEKATKEAKKRQKKTKATTTKTAKTKATTKANGTAKAKPLADPTTKKAPAKKTSTKATAKEAKQLNRQAKKTQTAKVKDMKTKATKENKVIREAKKKRDMEAPAIKQVAVGSNKAEERKKVNAQQNKEVQELNDFGTKKEDSATIDSMWSEKASKIMAKPVNKRSDADIKKVAGEITEANDKLARYVVSKMASARGMNVHNQVNLIGNKASKTVIRQETGMYGDMLQSARGAMYETLHNVLAGSQNPGKDTAIGAHVISRMKQKVHKDLYGLMNSIPAPHAIRGAIGDMKKAENTLSQELGRTPSHDEIAQHLQKTSTHFKEASIAPPPEWDEKANEWVAPRGHIKDPSERLRVLKNYADQQRTASADVNVGKEGEREAQLSVNIADEGRSPDEIYERKERQKELEGALPKAMRAMGMSDASIKVWTLTHSAPSEKRNVGQLTSAEVADHINANGGWEGAKISESWVRKHYSAGRKVIAQAVSDKHPALAQLSMLKSLAFYDMLKAVYEYDLVKSLSAWGMDTTVLQPQFVRVASGRSLYEVKKSLHPTEYVGAYVTDDTGRVHARITELAVPGNEELQKSFMEFGSELKKSMFPHKGGSNHAINEKASAYVKANKGKYSGMASSQQERVKQKKGALTWSEQLLLDNEGSCWISWGGKKLLVHGTTGEIKYDSSNSAHREESAKNHGTSTQEDKIDFHHEADELKDHEDAKEKEAMEAWEKEGKNKKGNMKTAFLNKHRLTENEDGTVTFNRHSEVSDDNRHIIDHGINAFNEDLGKMQGDWKNLKDQMKEDHKHRNTQHYADMSEEEREKYDQLSEDEKKKLTGQHILEKEGVKEAFQKFHDNHKSATTDEEKEAHANQLLEDLKGLDHGSRALSNKNIVLGKGANLAGLAGHVLKNGHDDHDSLADRIGTSEFARANEEIGKNHIPEGKYLVGNPQTGKTMVVHIGSGFEGGRGGRGGKFAPVIKEAFDPEGGKHEDLQSWGGLARALNFKTANGGTPDIKKMISDKANTDSSNPMLKPISEEEYQDHRANTQLGLQESMLHNNFRKVDEAVDKDGNLIRSSYAMDMPDGTQNVIEVGKDGYIKDPIMARLLDLRKPIESEDDLHEALKNAVGNRAWITAHAGGDAHIGDVLGHHVQLEYDGKGSPRVIGGEYAGYRFMDEKDIPKGAIDPATGEPIKALFKNGKLVDRKFSTKNDVPMEVGNSVMYPAENGFRKGKIHSEGEGGSLKVVDSKGNVIGMFKKDELKHAKEDGRMLANSGKVVGTVHNMGVHRMNPSEVFGDDKKGQKARELFEQALRKAKVNKAFDENGNLKKELELSDPMHRNLKKVLGRSKAGRELLKNFSSTHTPELALHVPEDKRAIVEAEGVTVRKDGTAIISASKFEHMRNILGGMSLDHKAQNHLQDHFRRKDRTPKSMDELRKNYQPSQAEGIHADKFREQFKEGSFLMNPSQGLYGTQLEGVSHLVERKNAIAGHGMGTGKTILGIMAGLHYKAQKLAKGQKPKKTLIVAPKGITSDWGKEIGEHTNSKALYIGNFSGGTPITGEDGKPTGRKLWGQKGTEQEAVGYKSFKKNSEKHASEDHDFHVMSYDTFMRNREHLAGSGMYDNIVIDEIHAFKNKKGKRGKSLAETTSKFSNVWGLSGTPMENDAREIHSLVDTITGGKHELGTKAEFQEKFMMKDKNGKITGVKPDHETQKKLGDILANVIQFRGGEDVKYNDGSKIHFPHLVGAQGTEDNPNPHMDFIGNMADRSRDHSTNEYYGTKHSVTDFETGDQEVTSKGGDKYNVRTFSPKGVQGQTKKMYEKYAELQQKYLPESKLAELKTASATGYDTGKQGKDNYLTAMQKLQKFLNAPHSADMYVPGGGSAIDHEATGVQAEKPGKDKAKAEPIPFETDSNGFKRYYKSDGKGGYVKGVDGKPELLPPLHHNNPKAQYLEKRLRTYLDSVASENAERRAQGKTEIMPKVVVKSSYTTFGTDIVDNVLHDLTHGENAHPEIQRWKSKTGDNFGAGRFTGDATDREGTKTGFRGNKKNYANEQGNLWATTVSPAGKEGVDFGNAHYMVHFDQEYNPQKMAQFTARVRRSDSKAKGHDSVERANAVRVESLHMPGTVEDFMFDAQDAKMKDIKGVVDSTKTAEKAPKLGDTASGMGQTSKPFTRGKNRKVGAKPKNPQQASPRKAPAKGRASKDIVAQGRAVAQADKAFKLVVLL